jgi:hypothetical protein
MNPSTMGLAAALAWLLGMIAQDSIPAPSVVSIHEIPALHLVAGSSDTVLVSIEIAEGFHVQANPASDEFLIATELQFVARAGVEAQVHAYPPPIPFRLEGADEDLKTYEGRTAIPLVVVAADTTASGDFVLEGKLDYQACDARRCLFPKSLPIWLPVVVTGSAVR